MSFVGSGGGFFFLIDISTYKRQKTPQYGLWAYFGFLDKKVPKCYPGASYFLGT
jgi:hypothetical protein